MAPDDDSVSQVSNANLYKDVYSMKDIIEYCPVAPPYGGVTVYVRRLGEALLRDGFTVGGYYTDECTDSKIICSDDYYLFETSSSDSKVVRMFSQIKRMIDHARHISKYRVVHYHGLENLKFIWWLHRYMGKKVVITVHSAMIESFYRRTDNLNKHYMKLLAEGDVRWIAVSTQARECMQRLPFSFRHEIPVIPAYIPNEVPEFIPLNQDMTNYINRHDKILSFYARSFMTNDGVDVYGFETILRLYEEILNRRQERIGLVFCLSDTSDVSGIANLHMIARDFGIDDKIYWQIGAIDNISSLWIKTDVYIRPTSTDGDSVAVREVLDLGAPVVASDVCPRPEGVIQYRHGNLESLVNAVDKALDYGRKEICYNYRIYNMMKEVVQAVLEK